MRADYRTVDRISQTRDRPRPHRSRHSRDDAGGHGYYGDVQSNYKWVKTSGLITAEKWGNLPGGEVFTAPGEVNGTFVIDGVVGDWLCDRYGLLEATPSH
jgi:hypothetical protein